MQSASRNAENQNCSHVQRLIIQSVKRPRKESPTSSTRQLDIHSHVVMLKVAKPRGNWHHSVIMFRHGSLRHRVPNRRTGKVVLPVSPSFRVNCASMPFAVPLLAPFLGPEGPAASALRYQWASCWARTHNSVQICPCVSGRLRSSRLARSRIESSRGRVSGG